LDGFGGAFDKAKAVWASYLRDLSPIRDATSLDDLTAWARGQGGAAGFGFNGDVVRACVVHGLFRALGATTFVETGTFRGATSILAARLLRCSVHSTELDPKSYLISRLRCAPFRRIHVYRGDSRRFLKRMGERLGPGHIPFVYLDAHWNEDLPLQAELDIVVSYWPRFVVLIDDFEVPTKPGFGFDAERPPALSLDNFTLPQPGGPTRSGIFFPAYDPEQEVGARRGYVVVVGGLRDRLDRSDAFPLSLLAPHDAPSSSGGAAR